MHLKLCLLLGLAVVASSRRCKSTPGTQFWPTPEEWHAFNQTVNGRLHATVPLAAPCHQSLDGRITTFDATRCAFLKEHWSEMGIHVTDPTSIFNTPYANGSCLLTNDPTESCTLGYHPAFFVNVSGAHDIAETVRFAKEHNVRVVIKNTGHDYIGKSTGAHGLEIWTETLKNMTFHKSLSVCGKLFENTITAAAGVQGGEVLAFAKTNGRVVVTGQCSTVGWAGGYLQGGGHGPLMLRYGLGADQLLSVGIVTASGQLVTASACQNPDLFWAIAGGGGGTFGVATSVTVKTYPDMVTSGAILLVSIPPSETNTTRYWDAVKAFYEFTTTSISEKGVYMEIYQDIPNGLLSVNPFIAYGVSLDGLKELIQPFQSSLSALGVEYNINFSSFENYADALESLYVVAHGNTFSPGSRLIPRSIVFKSPAAVANTIREINELGIAIHCFILPPGVAGVGRRTANNAVNPAFNDALMHAEMTLPIGANTTITERNAAIERITSATNATLEKLAPGSGAYLNEANSGEPAWQHTFYGDHYPRLLSIKRQWDPEGVFWARTAVGSEGMIEDGYTGELCEV